MKWLAAAWVVVLATAGCANRRDATSPPPETPKAEYSARAARLFDDSLAPGLFGFDPQVTDPGKDPLLAERVVRADSVFPGRVESLSRVGGVVGLGAFELVVRPTGPPLAGEAPAGPETLLIPANAPSYPWLKGAAASWVGARVILFVKRFSGPDGPVLHFRAEPDGEPMRQAIDRLKALRVLRH